MKGELKAEPTRYLVGYKTPWRLFYDHFLSSMLVYFIDCASRALSQLLVCVVNISKLYNKCNVGHNPDLIFLCFLFLSGALFCF